MKKIWKNALGVSLVAAVSVGATLATNAYLMDNHVYTTNNDPAYSFNQSPVRLASYSTGTEGGLDFTKAAENSIHGVVHIKATTNAKAQSGSDNQQMMDPFEYFFGFGGRGNFQSPQQSMPKVGAGSGVIISEDGYIITNNHVIEGADELEVTLNDNRKFEATLVGTDPSTDIALLKINASGLTIIPFGDSEALKIGEWVLAVGNPFNLTSTVTAGIVSAKGRGISAGGASKIESFIQTDAAVNPGNSGGALVNTKGELVGINTAIYSETGNFAGYSFAVPISIAGKVAADLKQYGTVQRAMLGVQIVSVGELNDRLSLPNLESSAKEEYQALKNKLKVTEGACVAGFGDRSTAKEAGMEIGDVITAVNGVKVKSANALQEQISKFRPGDVVDITADRSGKTMHFKVELKNAQGNTAVVKTPTNSTDALGATFNSLSETQMRNLGVVSGIEVSAVSDGKLKKAGVEKGFIIQSVNNQRVYSVEQFEKITNQVAKNTSGDQYLVIRGFYPGGKLKVFAIDLSE
jgi:Do/DeqQ family serine protease